jgi:1-acyl-sn-glycerol-3-phosphate acyltransferase
MVPPRVVRRVVFPPVLVAIALAVTVVAPLVFLVGLVASRGRHRLLRVSVVGVAWLGLELAALGSCLVLWVAGLLGTRPAGAYEERHYALCGRFLARLYAVASWALGPVVEIREPGNASTDRPVIVLSRHAGPGDSFLIVHFLLNLYARRPRIVLKAALQYDPALDVVLNRLPNAFIAPRDSPRERSVAEITRLAAGLDSRDAVLIFPEGGNFTPHRRVRAIRRLRRRGRVAEAERARRMTNVLPPHTAGPLAAIEAAPTADVIFVAHTGFGDQASVAEVWRRVPLDQALVARWWRVPFEEIPDHDRDRWLYDWWERIDAWIAENRPDRPAAEVH